jgi:hypothetical protein
VTKVKVTLLKLEIQFPFNNFSLLLSIDAKLCVWVVYIKRQLGIATRVSVIKVNVTIAINKIQF